MGFDASFAVELFGAEFASESWLLLLKLVKFHVGFERSQRALNLTTLRTDKIIVAMFLHVDLHALLRMELPLANVARVLRLLLFLLLFTFRRMVQGHMLLHDLCGVVRQNFPTQITLLVSGEPELMVLQPLLVLEFPAAHVTLLGFEHFNRLVGVAILCVLGGRVLQLFGFGLERFWAHTAVEAVGLGRWLSGFSDARRLVGHLDHILWIRIEELHLHAEQNGFGFYIGSTRQWFLLDGNEAKLGHLLVDM